MHEGPSEPKKRGGYAKGDARKQQILGRAIEVFAQRGANRTSLRAIAEAVGVTHGTLVHHFGSLDELLVAVYTASDTALDERILLTESSTPVEIMIESARANRTVPGLVQLYSTLMASALEDGHPAATDFAKSWFTTVREDLAERVHEQQKAGRIRSDLEPRAVASLVIAASDGLQTQWLLDDTAPKMKHWRLWKRCCRPTPDQSGELPMRSPVRLAATAERPPADRSSATGAQVDADRSSRDHTDDEGVASGRLRAELRRRCAPAPARPSRDRRHAHALRDHEAQRHPRHRLHSPSPGRTLVPARPRDPQRRRCALAALVHNSRLPLRRDHRPAP